jgi:hypothetical protein
MDRRTRPAIARRSARRGLARAVALPIALLAAGCGGQANVQIQGSGVPGFRTVPAGTALSGGSLSASIQGSSAAGALLAVGLLGATVFWESERDRVHYRPPALDPARTVNVQDCSRPIENWSANLKCR